MFDISISLLVAAGALLLAIAALLGFQVHRSTADAAALAHWRVVHNGGTAGGVQLLALAAVWSKLVSATSESLVCIVSLVVGTWLMFVGPLLTAMAKPRIGKLLARSGAFAAIPAYLLLVWFVLVRLGS